MAGSGGEESFSARMKRLMEERVDGRKRRGDDQRSVHAPAPQPLPVGPPPPPQPTVSPPFAAGAPNSVVSQIAHKVG